MKKNDMWHDEFEQYEFFLTMMVDYGLLSGEELIEDARKSVNNRDGEINTYGEKAQSSLNRLVYSFISMFNDFACRWLETEGLLDQREDRADRLPRVLEFFLYRTISASKELFEDYVKRADQKYPTVLIDRQVEIVEFTVGQMKSAQMIPESVILDTSRLNEGFFTLARSKENMPIRIESAVVGGFLGGVKLSRSKSLTSSELVQRWMAYIVFEKFLIDGHIPIEIKDAAQRLGIVYAHIKSQESKYFNGEISEEAYELELWDVYKNNFLKDGRELTNFIQGVKGKTQSEINLYLHTLFSVKIDEEFYVLDSEDDLETLDCFWYIKRELSKPFMERNAGIIKRLKDTLTRLREYPEGTKLRERAEEGDIYFLLENAYLIELLECDDTKLREFITEQVNKAVNSIRSQEYRVEIDTSSASYNDNNSIYFIARGRGRSTGTETTSGLKDEVLIKIIEEFKYWGVDLLMATTKSEYRDRYRQYDININARGVVADQPLSTPLTLPLVNIKKIEADTKEANIKKSLNLLRLLNDLSPKEIKIILWKKR